MNVAVFQDYARSLDGKDADAASVFFELANAELIGYRIGNKSSSTNKDDAMVIIKQHSDAKTHTGGIVWETSYLLANYLSLKFGSNSDRNNVDEHHKHPLGKTLEIGAGCGMLGLILAAKKLSSRVIMTEAAEVMDILHKNVNQNVAEIKSLTTDNNESDSDDMKGIYGTNHIPACPKERVSVRRLRWDCLEEDVPPASMTQENDLRPNSFDTIVGTDVVFSPALVCPLLETIQLMARKKEAESTKSTIIYLCLQIRCADSHSSLFSEAHKYGLEVVDVSEELAAFCPWAVELECLLLKINVKGETTKQRKKRKQASNEKKSKKKPSKVKKSKKSSKRRKIDSL